MQPSETLYKMPMRFDLQIIASWIEPGTKVLDLGCGAGELLHYLKEKKGVIGTGIEHREDKVIQCIERGLSVLQGDINEEVLDYPPASFDVIVLSQTLQQVYQPAELLKSLLEVGKMVVVSFPNFAHYTCRLQLLLSGYVPKTEQLPYEWYDTPNIRVISIKNFKRFAQQVGFDIVKEAAIDTSHHGAKGEIIKFFSNLRATYGIFLIQKRG